MSSCLFLWLLLRLLSQWFWGIHQAVLPRNFLHISSPEPRAPTHGHIRGLERLRSVHWSSAHLFPVFSVSVWAVSIAMSSSSLTCSSAESNLPLSSSRLFPFPSWHRVFISGILFGSFYVLFSPLNMLFSSTVLSTWNVLIIALLRSLSNLPPVPFLGLLLLIFLLPVRCISLFLCMSGDFFLIGH